jgi:hypothetical protein
VADQGGILGGAGAVADPRIRSAIRATSTSATRSSPARIAAASGWTARPWRAKSPGEKNTSA